jgi:hypothetical protein
VATAQQLGKGSVAGALAGALVFPAAPGMAGPKSPVPGAGTVTIDAVTASGSSCRPGSTAVSISPDNQAFTVTYSQFVAHAGAGANGGDSHAKCQLHVNVHTPAGYTYAVTEVDYRGWASIAAGATATETGSFSLQGDNTKTGGSHTLTGPYGLDDSGWEFSDVSSQPVYVPCNRERKLDVIAELRVDASKSDPESSVIGMDSIDGSTGSTHRVSTYRFAWKTC